MAGLNPLLSDAPAQPPAGSSGNPLLGDYHPPAQTATATPPKQAPASFLEQVGGTLDFPFILNSADQRAHVNGPGEYSKALKAFLANPALANREYGLMSKPQLEFERTHNAGGVTSIIPGMDKVNQAGAGFFEQHPKLAGATAFGAEWWNPANKLVNPLLSTGNKIARAIPGVAKVEDAVGEGISKTFDLFHGVRKAGGVAGEARMRDLFAGVTEAQNSARDDVQTVFGGLTPAQQRLVVHAYQDPRLVRNMPPEIAARAAKLDSFVRTLDQHQLDLGLITPDKMWSRTRYFPMRGAYVDPEYDEEELDILGNIRNQFTKGGKVQVVKGTAGATAPRKVIPTLAEAENSNLLKPDFLPAKQLLNHLAPRYGNVAAETGLRALPSTLRADTRYVDQMGHEAKEDPFRRSREAVLQHVEENQQKYPVGHPERYEAQRPGEHFYGQDVLATIGSPTLRDSTVHPEVVKLLRRTAASLPDADKQGVLKALDTFNKFARIGIIANPAVHVGWNLTYNFLAAGGSWDDVGAVWAKTARAMGQAAGGKAITTAERTAPRIAEAQFARTRPMFGSDEARALTVPTANLTGLEKADKLATNLWERNQQVVFDVAEREFADRLYTKLAPKLGDDAAAIQVRKALGDYANTDPTSLANRLFIFYPWLKTVVPFWAKTLAKAPEHVTAPVEGIRRNNELVDKNFNAPRKNPRGDFTAELGQDSRGQMRDFSVPHPARILSELATPIESAMGGGDLTHALSGPQRIAESHINPAAGSVFDLFSTLLSKSSDPAQGGNFRTVFDKSAPPVEQAKQAAGFAGSRLAGGLPFSLQIQDLPRWAKDLAGGGASPEDFMGLGGGTVFRAPGQAQQKQLYALRDKYERDSAHLQGKQLENRYRMYVQARDRLLNKQHPQSSPPVHPAGNPLLQ